MKKFIRNLTIILILGAFVLNGNVFASNLLVESNYTEEFKEWLKLPTEEKANTLMPRMFEVKYENVTYYNPLKSARLLGNGLENKYDLRTDIGEKLSIKNQQQSNSCWAFATFSSLETNLSLKNSGKIYDFSEAHMEYYTSNSFTNNDGTNLFNRAVGVGGNWLLASAYLTNGSGAITENKMIFDNYYNSIISSTKIEYVPQRAETVILDTVSFSSLPENSTEKESYMAKLKNHIKNNGSIYASIHAEGINNETCYKETTNEDEELIPALYCNKNTCETDHAVSIIGWDDTISTSYFKEEPEGPGAWLVRNSWGEEFGNNGVFYVSYYDINIYDELYGIVNASEEVNYENIYQYNDLGWNGYIDVGEHPNVFGENPDTIYVKNIFDKKTAEDEYITQVGIDVLEPCNCKVYIGEILEEYEVELKAEAIYSAGYHTLEFSKPVKVENDEFTVIVAIEDATTLAVEASGELDDGNGGKTTIWQNATTQTARCFITTDVLLETETEESAKWYLLDNEGDTTIKAFTVSSIEEEMILESINIETNNNFKTEYNEGETFDKTGMTITAKYSDGTTKDIEISNCSITVPDDFTTEPGDKTITISYTEGQGEETITVTKTITVTVTPAGDEPSGNEPSGDEPSGDEPSGDEPSGDEPSGDEPSGDEPSGDEPSGDEPSGDEPSGDEPSGDEPSGDEPSGDEPSGDEPSEEKIANNSNFDNAKVNVLKVASYMYTDPEREEYVIMNVEISDIIRNLKNDSVEYYYYLSTSKNETGIQDWIKISEEQKDEDILKFSIDTKDVSNYEELAASNNLYVYIKEVAKRAGNQKVFISKAYEVKSDIEIEEYLDDTKIEKKPEQGTDNKQEEKPKEDDSTSKEVIPDAGKKILLIFAICGAACVLLISYKKYRTLKDIK